MAKRTTKNRKRHSRTKESLRRKKRAGASSGSRRKTKLTRGRKSTLSRSRTRRHRRPTCDVPLFDKSISTLEVTGGSIDHLDLVDYAKEAAHTVLKAHPTVVFTSGRRSVKQQANAMAGNVVQNRNWIKQTYAPSGMRSKSGSMITHRQLPNPPFQLVWKAL